MIRKMISILALTIQLSGTWITTSADTIEQAILKPPTIYSDAAVLMDADTGQILYEKNMDKVLYPASITKVMTGLLALENGNLEDVIVMSRNAVFSVPRGAAHIALDTGEEIRLQDAMNALAVESANDAANGVAEYLAGDLNEFSNMMNERAVELGASHTHFTNSNGLEDEQHVTTAHDMALIMAQAVKTPEFNRIFSQGKATMAPTNLQEETRYFNNSNALLNGKNTYEGLIASKTGWTPSARHNLATAAQRDGRTLVVVIMNCPDMDSKYSDTEKLLDYGFNGFTKIDLTSAIHIEGFEMPKKTVITRLIHNSLGFEDVLLSINPEIPYSQETADKNLPVKVSIGIKVLDEAVNRVGNLMHKDMGSLVISMKQVYIPNPDNQIVDNNGTIPKANEEIKKAPISGIVIIIFFLAITSSFVGLRLVDRMRFKKKMQTIKRNRMKETMFRED